MIEGTWVSAISPQLEWLQSASSEYSGVSLRKFSLIQQCEKHHNGDETAIRS